MTEAKCCKIDCDELATHEIRQIVPAGELASEVHSCLAHIPDLMTGATVHEVVKLREAGDPSPVYR